MQTYSSPYLDLLKNKINLLDVPFTERGSRLMVFGGPNGLYVRLSERWIKRDQKLAAYRTRLPLLDEIIVLNADGDRLPLDVTTYPHQVQLDSPVGQFILTFHDTETLLPRSPPGAGRLWATAISSVTSGLATLSASSHNTTCVNACNKV